MRKGITILFTLSLITISLAQNPVKYQVSFEKAAQHLANIQVQFKAIPTEEFTFRMSRSSPGRYALHEYAKNVFDVTAKDGEGNPLTLSRPDPYSWKVNDHDGTVVVNYTLFANHGDGTYSQVDETHAHLNAPATYMWGEGLEQREIEIHFEIREDLDWKVATQLKKLEGTTYYAPHMQYFMDSPVEISNHEIRSFNVDGQTISFVLHHNGTKEEFDQYFEATKKVVLEQKKVFGELPSFDFGTYTFLGCYIPNASGDGMEHRNSTILTSTSNIKQRFTGLLGTVSHEFFHCWNVERIRPASLEPFDYTQANMSGELWFAEGFTSYYGNLILSRTGARSQEEFIQRLNGTFNYVWNSPALEYCNPIEMSLKAPFVDAATTVDETFWENTFVSYYSYGYMLALTLDLSLREKGLNLDDYMKLVWREHGIDEVPYTVENLRDLLGQYANEDFAKNFFNRYIYDSQVPDFESIFENVGVAVSRNTEDVSLGFYFSKRLVQSNPLFGSASYDAGLVKGDKLLMFGEIEITDQTDMGQILEVYKPGDNVQVTFKRYGQEKTTTLDFPPGKRYELSVMVNATDSQLKERNAWLGSQD